MVLIVIRVKVVLAEKPARAVSGVRLSLFDRDLDKEDDLLGESVSDLDGIARFTFDSEVYTGGEDAPIWKAESLPDLYVVVKNAAGDEIFSTRDRVMENKLPKEFTVVLPQNVAANLS